MNVSLRTPYKVNAVKQYEGTDTMHTISNKLVGVTISGVLLLSLNCAGLRPGIVPDPGIASEDLAYPPDKETIHIQYLGSGGDLIYRNGVGVLTAPIYSNPTTLRVGFGCIAPDTNRINQLVPKVPGVKVAAILVGHAHYDHLLDVPHIANRHTLDAAIYGNASVSRIMTAADHDLGKRTHVLDDELSREGQPGRWIYLADSTIRFMGIESDHGAHAMGIHVMQGEVREHLTRPPRSAWAWKEGQTIAYLIDFLGPDGKVEFRIHHQDATSHYPLGAPPEFVPPDTHRLDVAIISVGSWFQLPDYPTALVQRHQPRLVILGHWDTFFRSPFKPPRPIPYATRLRKFVPFLKAHLPPDSDWLLPTPGATYLYHPVNGSVEESTP
jgi:L-ascorbate metabolism protein UlaG (beta-lactamase superfamily)